MMQACPSKWSCGRGQVLQQESFLTVSSTGLQKASQHLTRWTTGQRHTSLLIHFTSVTPRRKMFIRVFFLCVFNSKILTLQELPSSDQKTVGERLNQKNGDIQHSTEKLPNGPDAASSKLTNTTNQYTSGSQAFQLDIFFLDLHLHTAYVNNINCNLYTSKTEISLSHRYCSFPAVSFLSHLPLESDYNGDVPVENHLLYGSDEQDAGVHGHPWERASWVSNPPQFQQTAFKFGVIIKNIFFHFSYWGTGDWGKRERWAAY